MSSTEQNWYTLHDESSPDSPQLLVYADRVKQNIKACAGMVKDTSRLRPHLKTSKAREPLQLMMQAGITKYKCATIAEAEMAGMCGVQDLLLAYQPDAARAARLWKLIEKYPDTEYSCLVDNYHTAQLLAVDAASRSKVLTVYLDLNVGMNRTGIVPGSEAIALYRAIAALPFLQVKGLHAYDGHIHDTELGAREQKVAAAFAPVWQMVAAITQAGLSAPVVLAGGSPTFPVHAANEKVECSPGTFIYWDYGYAHAYPDQPFLPAVVLATRVVSIPAPGLICLDAGHKAVGAENVLDKRLHLLNLPGHRIVSQSEEHLVVQVPDDTEVEIGELIYALPFHVCPTVALHQNMGVVEDKEITGSWETVARNRKITI